jgi:hypothetical protein
LGGRRGAVVVVLAVVALGRAFEVLARRRGLRLSWRVCEAREGALRRVREGARGARGGGVQRAI